MNKNEILEEYNLETYINTELSQNYKDLESIQRYIKKNGEENLDLFSEMFWADKSDSISNLKKELNWKY